MEFFEWSYLGTYAGAMLATAVLTQLTKELKGISRIPTQLWSYVLALVTLLLATVFSGNFTLSNAVLTLFNAAIVSLASNGGYEMMKRVGGTGSQQTG